MTRPVNSPEQKKKKKGMDCFFLDHKKQVDLNSSKLGQFKTYVLTKFSAHFSF